MSFGQELFVL